ncbi:MAG: methylenetetrahydrofolate reductase [Psychrobium sp.]
MDSVLRAKSEDAKFGVYFIGTTPPREGMPLENVEEIADKLVARLDKVDFDGLIVYDIQDESSRTDETRPFPFKKTFEPCHYSQILNGKTNKPVITYKSVAAKNSDEFNQWLDNSWQLYGVRDIVLVGSPSSKGVPKLALQDAYKAQLEHRHNYYVGGVTIAERHAKKGDEHLRLLEKDKQGCEYFISQAVYDAPATIDMLVSYARECRAQGIRPKRMVLTFTPCGSEKTMDFMKWLGISIPESTRWRILESANPLAESIKVCRSNLTQIIEAVMPLNIPLGLNIESLTNRKEEIDAAIRLYKLLKATYDMALAERELRSIEMES